MASSYVVKQLVASTTRRSPFVVPFHRPAALATSSRRRAFATTPMPKYTYEHYSYKARRLWFNITGFVNIFSPYMNFRKILKITSHTFSMSYDSRLDASGDELRGCKLSLNFPGIEEFKETDEELCMVLDTGMGNWYDYTQRDRECRVDSGNTLLSIDIRAHNKHKQGICSSRMYLPAGLKDAIWKSDHMTKDGLLIIRFSKVKPMEGIETKDNGVVKQ